VTTGRAASRLARPYAPADGHARRSAGALRGPALRHTVGLGHALPRAVAAVNRFSGRVVGPAVLRPLLAALRIRHRLTRLGYRLERSIKVRTAFYYLARSFTVAVEPLAGGVQPIQRDVGEASVEL
jgi:hypothetical protein